MKLSCLDWSDWVRSVEKTRQDNDMTDCIDADYAKNKTVQLWSIELGIVYDENLIGQ